MDKKFHTKTAKETLALLDVSGENGLSFEEVKRREILYGLNVLPESRKKPWYLQLASHFNNFLVLVLLAAAIFSLVIGDVKDGIVIFIIVLVNVFMGYLQEMKADNAVRALKKMSSSFAKVIRDGTSQIINTENLVPGDIILIENGDKVPADARLIEAIQLKVSEASLTGESKPSDKEADFIGAENIPLGDIRNFVYKDTLVVFGRGTAVVTGTGKNTQIGKIFSLLEKKESKVSPLAFELKKIGKGLTVFAVLTALLILIILFFSTNSSLKVAIFTAISMAIAVVPEGIPAVVTTVLAISVARLAKNQAIIRKMESVETLGAATCILTDKTGTLTKNEMSVTDIYTSLRSIKVTDKKFFESENEVDLLTDPKTKWLLYCAVLCNDARVTPDNGLMGDPTEACLLTLAMNAGINVETVRQEYQRIEEIPFTSESKFMTVVVKDGNSMVHIITKGAAESVNKLISGDTSDGLNATERLSSQGIRSLTYASKSFLFTDFIWDDNAIKGQEYLGVIGCKDPLRPEVKDAVLLAKDAGIRTVMITGDHKLIAQNIGTELGIVTNEKQIIDGNELAKLTKNDLQEYFKKVNAFSRVSPEQKLNIVEAAQSNGEIVIVTGDGVNDGPAIKKADIGVAMGVTGTDVAKEVSDMVLRDDNYSTIVKAIEQGRGIFGNFIKFLKYQISCNLSGVLIVVPISIVTGTTPLAPIHILLLNLVSETGPSIALGLEKTEKNIMKTKPRKKNEPLLTKERWWLVVFEAIVLAFAGVTVYFIASHLNPTARATAVLVTAFLSRLWHAFSSRSDKELVFSRGLKSNSFLSYIVIFTLLVLMFLIYTSVGNEIFVTVPLSKQLLFLCFIFSVVPLLFIESFKLVRKYYGRNFKSYN